MVAKTANYVISFCKTLFSLFSTIKRYGSITITLKEDVLLVLLMNKLSGLAQSMLAINI
jgi:hypothetical protein